MRGSQTTPHELKGNNDVLVLTQPEAIARIHDAYLAAGADIVETDTFTSTAVAQADYGLESAAYEMNVAAARLARGAADRWTERTPERPRFVAGAIGPTNRSLSMSPDVNDPTFRAVTFDAVRDAYAEQARGLLDGGCHMLLVETVFDTLNAKAAIAAILDVFEERGAAVPLLISVTITDRSGRTLSGQTIDAFWVSIAHARPLLGRHQLRARRPGDAALPHGAGPPRRHLGELLPERRTAERLRRVRRAPRGDGAAAPGVRGKRPRQPGRRLLRDDPGSHRGGRRGGGRRGRPAPGRSRPSATRRRAGSSASPSGRTATS